jgi:carbon monoxide dehydrogenase subunit G
MKLTATYTIAAARPRVFAALTDPAVLQRAIDGCESFTQTGESTYEARLRVGVGSIKGVFTGQARMEHARPPESYTLAIDGRGGPGWVKGSAEMRLLDEGAQTSVICDADVVVGGVVAAVGSRLIAAAAKRMMDQFFARLGTELTGGAPRGS